MADKTLGMTIKIDEDGELEYVEYDDGVRVAATENHLPDNPATNIDLYEIKSLHLVKYYDHASDAFKRCVHKYNCMWICR